MAVVGSVHGEATQGHYGGRHLGLLVLATLFVLGSCKPIAGGKQSGDSRCAVSVLAVRDKRPTEQPMVLHLRYRGAGDPNSVLGPDSLRLIVEAPEGHPRVLVEDTRTGAKDDIVGSIAERPTWSPDGRYIAFVAYVSQEQPYQLAVFDRRSRKRIDIDPRLATDEYRWSPDSRWIAVEGVERGTNHVGLSVYELARGRLRRISTTPAFGSYGLSWSPDSKFLAFTEPSEVGEDESVLAADLWVAQTSS